MENNGHSIVFKVDNHQSVSSQINHYNGPNNNQQLNGASALSAANALNNQLKSADFFSAALAEQQSANALLDLQGIFFAYDFN